MDITNFSESASDCTSWDALSTCSTRSKEGSTSDSDYEFIESSQSEAAISQSPSLKESSVLQAATIPQPATSDEDDEFIIEIDGWQKYAFKMEILPSGRMRLLQESVRRIWTTKEKDDDEQAEPNSEENSVGYEEIGTVESVRVEVEEKVVEQPASNGSARPRGLGEKHEAASPTTVTQPLTTDDNHPELVSIFFTGEIGFASISFDNEANYAPFITEVLNRCARVRETRPFIGDCHPVVRDAPYEYKVCTGTGGYELVSSKLSMQVLDSPLDRQLHARWLWEGFLRMRNIFLDLEKDQQIRAEEWTKAGLKGFELLWKVQALYTDEGPISYYGSELEGDEDLMLITGVSVENSSMYQWLKSVGFEDISWWSTKAGHGFLYGDFVDILLKFERKDRAELEGSC
ncbi:hypothetical protein BJ508DRAFT_334873 [Ascobolus immersus RN42]|uniref:Uncharacterized protein n=1 Tax=Ascobolus immersus RN42 TaxID=1160509 RepID=A0A3N4HJ18_ASCIM|nr:hypothetical protein BJ508DRAFT_334873 [Ascobolus immersus RN42]